MGAAALTYLLLSQEFQNQPHFHPHPNNLEALGNSFIRATALAGPLHTEILSAIRHKDNRFLSTTAFHLYHYTLSLESAALVRTRSQI